MNKHLLSLSLVISSILVFSQNEIGIKANLGLSKASSIARIIGTHDEYKNNFTPSGGIGVYYKNRLSKKSSLGTDIIIHHYESKESQINYRRYVDEEYVENVTIIS